MRTPRLVLPVLVLTLGLVGCSAADSEEPATGPAKKERVEEAAAAQQDAEEAPQEEAPQEEAPETEEEAEEAPDVEQPPADATALESYVATERATIGLILESTQGMYSEVDIRAEGTDTIVFDYVYAEPLDAAAAEAYFDSMVQTLQDLCDTQVFPAMERAGVIAPKATYAYYNADGSQIWAHTFQQG